MAKTIYQRVALEGGDKIAKELRAIGKNGEAAFLEIGAAADKLKKSLANVGSSVGKLGDSLATVGKRMTIATAAIVGAVAGVVAFAKVGTDAADAAKKQAQEAGLAIDAYGRLSFAAEQSGVSQEELGGAMARLNRELGEVAGGSEKAKAKFAALGINVQDATGKLKPTEAIVRELADRFNKLPDGAEKSALAIDLFGKAGAGMLPFLNAGGAGLAALGAQAEALGIVFTNEQGTIAEAMNDSLAALNKARVGVQSQIGLLFAPVITRGSDAIIDIITRNRQAMVDWTDELVNKTVPIVEDFAKVLSGDFAGVQNTWVLKVALAFVTFGENVQAAVYGIVIPAFNALTTAADFLADAFNGIFGTDFTGQQILIAAAISKLLGLFGLLSASVGVVASAFGALGPLWGLAVAAAGLLAPAFTAIGTAAAAAGTALVGIIGLPALIITGIIAAGAAIYIFWDEIKAGAGLAYDFIAGIFEGLPALIGGFITGAANVASAAWDGIASLGAAAFAKVRESAVKEGGIINSVWSAHVELFNVIWAAIKNGASLAWGFVKDGFTGAFDYLGNLVDRVASRITAAFERIKAAARAAVDAARAAASADASSNKSSQLAGFATGGYVRGPGSGTSDSIMARLSNGEFVVKAAAVRHYGPQLLAALNNMRLPKTPGFAAGGLVDGLTKGFNVGMPRFASGGAVVAQSGGRPVTLNIDGRAFEGMTATDKTAEDLTRFATARRLRSAGRKPGWVGV